MEQRIDITCITITLKALEGEHNYSLVTESRTVSKDGNARFISASCAVFGEISMKYGKVYTSVDYSNGLEIFAQICCKSVALVEFYTVSLVEEVEALLQEEQAAIQLYMGSLNKLIESNARTIEPYDS